jgi:transcription-repair coupling factor (superfamily II helicase)
VGRSHHQAYAYLLIRDKKALTPDALKRLEAISVLEDLGIGFTLATHDLEIRGAGEFLGQEQSGNIQAVGFSLYNELLERAVKALKSGNPVDLTKPFEKEIEIDMALPALIPEDYLPDVQERLQWYKRFSNGKTLEELEELQVEMVDRYGSLPLQTQYLLKITQLKLLGIPLGVQKIETHSQGGRILFKQKTSVSPQVILKLLQDKSQIYQLAGPSALKFKIPLPEAEMRLQFMEDLLKKLASSDTPLSSQNPIK